MEVKMGIMNWLSSIGLKLAAAEREKLPVQGQAARDTATKTLLRPPRDAVRLSYVITSSKDEDWGTVSHEAEPSGGPMVVRRKTQRPEKVSDDRDKAT
jgi:hypothetical protein